MAFDYDSSGAPIGSDGGFNYDADGKPIGAPTGQAASPDRTFGDTAKDIGISALKSAISVPEIAVGLADIPTGGAVGNLMESAGVRFKEAKRLLDEELSPAQQAANKRVEQVEGFFPTIGALLENPSVIGHGAIESLGSMGAGGVIGRGVVAAAPKVAPWIAAAIGEGAATAGSLAESTRQSTGNLTAAQSGMAVAAGIGTGALGAIGGRIAKRLGIDDVDTMLVKGIPANAGEDVAVETVKKGIVRRILEGGLSEGVFEELPQSAQEQVWQNAALGRPLAEGVDKAAAQGMLVGAAMGGGANLIGSTVRPAPTVADIDAAPTVPDAIAAAEAALAAPIDPFEATINAFKGEWAADAARIPADSALPMVGVEPSVAPTPDIALPTDGEPTGMPVVTPDRPVGPALIALASQLSIMPAGEQTKALMRLDSDMRQRVVQTMRALDPAVPSGIVTPPATEPPGMGEAGLITNAATTAASSVQPLPDATVTNVPAYTERAARERVSKEPGMEMRPHRQTPDRYEVVPIVQEPQPSAATAPITAEQQSAIDLARDASYSQPRRVFGQNSQLRSETGPDIKGEKVTRNMRKAIVQWSRFTGTKVVFEYAPGQSDGAMPVPGENTIHINTAAQINPLQVMGHEVTHILRDRFPSEWAKLRDALVATMPDKRVALQAFAENYWGVGEENAAKLDALAAMPDWSRELTPDERVAFGSSRSTLEDFLLDEMVSDLGGKHWTTEQFYIDTFAKIEKEYDTEKAKGIIERLVAAIKDVLGKFLEVVRAQKQDDFSTVTAEQLEKTRDAMSSAYAKFINEERTTEPDGKPHVTDHRISTSDMHSRSQGEGESQQGSDTLRPAAAPAAPETGDELSDARAAELASLSPQRAERNQRVEITDDDGSGVPNARLAEFDDEAYIQFAQTKKNTIALLSMASSDKHRGRDMLKWLSAKFGIPIRVYEVAPDAIGFWNKMEDEGAIRGWTTDRFSGKTVLPAPTVSRSEPRAAERNQRLFFEVAPNPNDTAAVAAWNKRTDVQKRKVSETVVSRIIPGLLSDIGVTGKVVTQLGGWMDDTNPSFALVVSRGDPALAARAVGYVLDQEAVYALGLKPFTGAEKTGIIHIDIAGKDAHKIYMQVRALDRDAISGHSTIGNEMLIGLPFERMKELEQDIDAIARKEGIAARLDEGYGATIKEYGYGLQLRMGNTDKQRTAERDVDKWRAEARAATGPDGTGSAVAGRGLAETNRRSEPRSGGSVSATGIHYSQQQRQYLTSAAFGTGLKGAELERVKQSDDPRIKHRIYFYTNSGSGIRSESGVGAHAHRAALTNLYDQEADPRDLTLGRDANEFESAVVDAGYNGYIAHSRGVAVLLGPRSVPVETVLTPDAPVAERAAPSPRRAAADRIAADRSLPSGRMTGAEWKRLVPEATHLADDKEYYKSALAGARMSEPRPPSWYYSPLARQAEAAQMKQAPASGWRTWLKSLAAKGVKPDEIKWSGIEEWLDAQGEARVTREQVQAYLSEFGVKVETILRGERNPIRPETVTQEMGDEDESEIDISFGDWRTDDPDDEWLSERASERLSEEIDSRVENTWEDHVSGITTVEDVNLETYEADVRADMGDMFEASVEDVNAEARRRAAMDIVRDTWHEYADDADVTLDDDPDYIAEAMDRAFAVVTGDKEAIETEARRRARADIDDDKLLDELTDRERDYYYEDYDSPQTQRITVDGVDGNFYHTYAYGDRQLYYDGRDIDLPRNADEADVEGAIREYIIANGLVEGVRGSDHSFRPTKWEGYVTDKNRAVPGTYREVQLTLPVGAFGMPVTETVKRDSYTVFDADGNATLGTVSEESAKREAERIGGRWEHKPDELRTARTAAKDFYYTTHWSEADVIGHARFDEHTDADGKRVMVLQEIQGDWGQQRREGLEAQERAEVLIKQIDAKREELIAATFALKEALPEADDAWTSSDWNNVKSMGSQALSNDVPSDAKVAADKMARLTNDVRELQREYNALSRDIPEAAPFIEKTAQWAGLVIKRMIAHAVDYGFDKVVWTSGAQQVERWRSSLRKEVDTIAWEKTEDGIHIVASQNGRQRTDTRVSETALSDAIGKTMARQIIADPNQRGEITGDDITISDTGMAGFYDRMLPTIANDILKKFDKTVRVQDIEVHPVDEIDTASTPNGWVVLRNGLDDSPFFDTESKAVALKERIETAQTAAAITTQQGFVITDKLRESAANGMPLFSQRRASSEARRSEARKEWYRSQLSDAVGNLPAKIRTGKEAALWLTSNAGKLSVKKDELQWSGVLDWLAGHGKQPVTGAQIQDWLGSNGVRVRTVMLGAGEDSAEYKRLGDELDGMDAEIATLRKVAHNPHALDIDTIRKAAAGNERATNDLSSVVPDQRQLDAMLAYGRALNRKNELFEQRNAARGEPVKYDRDGLVLPGGRKYRELLLTLPQRVPAHEFASIEQMRTFLNDNPRDDLNGMSDLEKFKVLNKERRKSGAQAAPFAGSHYPQPNILAHVRFDERIDADGKRVLFVQEVQSDWGQKGRKEGFRVPYAKTEVVAIDADSAAETYGKRNAELFWHFTVPDNVLQIPKSQYPTQESARKYILNEKSRTGATTPAAPFVTDTKSWVALALKRVISHAVDNGFDRVAWTTGEQQSARYDLSKQVDRLVVYGDNTVVGFKDGKNIVSAPFKDEAGLAGIVGKEAARKLLAATPDMNDNRVLSGVDLKVGGEGMIGFYDGIIPQVARSLGATVGTVRIQDPSLFRKGGFVGTAAATADQPGFDITDKMREQAAVGMPLFSQPRAPLDQWLGRSVVRTVMYHGTARDISTFRPQQADAIFLTDDPKFAAEFADLSHSWMVNNFWTWMSPEQIQSARRDAMRMLLRDALPGSSLYNREERLLNQSQQPSQYMRRAVEQYMPSESNVMPLYVRAENPFDYRNPEHVAAIEAELGPSWMGQESINGETRDVAQHIGDLERGDWNAIESPQVQAYIRAHHDSFYVRERGVTNLAVFSPNQVKSASGNDGAYSREDNDIRRSEVRYIPTREEAFKAQFADDFKRKEHEARIGQHSTDTEGVAFLKWFADSKVVSADGKPLRVYHGTGADIHAFKNRYAGKTWEMFSDSPDYASRFANYRNGNVVPAYLAIRNPLDLRSLPAVHDNVRNKLIDLLNEAGVDVDEKGLPYVSRLFQIINEGGYRTNLKTRIEAAGYDGIIMPDSHDGETHILATTYIAFSPTQIKSAISNTGAYSPTDPRISHSTPRSRRRIDAAIAAVYKDDRLYEALDFGPSNNSGPFDGGCLIAAKALIRAFGGGDLVRIVNSKNDVTDHYGARIDGTIYDFAGSAASPQAWIDRFQKDEHIKHAQVFAEGHDSTSDIPDDPTAEKKIAALLTAAVPPAPTLSTPRSRMTGQPINQTWTDPDVTDWDDLVRKMQDDKIDTKRVLRAIRDAGVAVAERFDAYMLETNYHGRAAARVTAFADGDLRHLLEDMAMRNLSMSDLDDYLWARHAPERNAANARSNPAITDGSGMSNAQSAAILAGQAVTINGRTIHLSSASLRGAAAVASRVDAITNGTLELLVQYGLETQATVDMWKRTYGSYAPLKRDMESDANYSGAFGLGNGTGSGFSVKGGAARRSLGSKRTVTDILANIAMQRERAIARGEKNRVAQAVYGLALSAPNPEFWIPVNTELNKKLSPAALAKAVAELVSIGVNPIDAQNLATEPVQRYIDPKTGLEMQRINPALRGRDDVLSTRINGEDRYLFFSNKKRAQEMVRGLKNLDAAEISGALQVIAPVTRWFASVNTQYNPVFGLTNGVRDFSTGMLNLSSTPLAAHRADVAREAFAALRGVYADLRDHRAGRVPTSRYAQLFEQFALDGGQTGYRDAFATSADRAEAIADELKHAGKGRSWLAVGEKRSHIFGWLSDYNTSVENAMRLASYKVALDNGMSRDAAASLAKNLTVNFNKKGLAATQTGALYAFFNASVQGTARMAQTMTTDGRLNAIGQKIVYGGMMLGVLQAVMGALAGWDDDEPPQFSREKNFIIPIPGSDKYVSLPMPLGFHVIPNIGRITTEWMLSGFRDPGKRLTRMAGVVLDSFNPIGSGTIAQTLSPTIGDPIIALGENKDWTGKSIFKEDFNKLHPTPGWTRTKDSASPPSRWLSYATNYVTGGGKYSIGMASPTPDQIDYLVGQATGGTGRELLKTAQYVSAKATGESLPIYKTPLGVGRFVGETKGQSSEISRFYRNLERIGEHKSAMDLMKHDGNGTAMRDYMVENPDARMVQMADKAHREVGYLTRQKREMIAAGANRERVKMMEERITGVARRYNEMMRVR